MLYTIGDTIDLTYLNRKHLQNTKRGSQKAGRFLDVGTQILFQLTPQGYKAAIRIPVIST